MVRRSSSAGLRRLPVLFLVVFAFTWFVPAADADIYWVAGVTASRIARADDQGRHVHTRFITGLRAVGTVALGAGSIYWTSGSSIGRASLAGRDVARSFIPRVGVVAGVAVDNRFVYWLSDIDPACRNRPGFGRAELDGRRAVRGFVCSAKRGAPIAVDGFASGIAARAGYLYWGWIGGIGRVATSGLQRYDNTFIKVPPGDSPAGVTVSNRFLYWGSYTFGPPIGRASVTGKQINPVFINGSSGDVGAELTVTPSYLYFTNDYFSGAAIARSTLGGVVSWDFIGGLDAVGDLVAGPRG